MRRLLIAVCMIAAVAAAGFAGEKKGTIGVSLLDMKNPFFKEIADNMAIEAAKHGYDVVAVDGANDVARQSNQVKDFITGRYACIVLSPCDSKAIGPVIREANDAGIPVFTVDIASLADNAEVVSHIATDNYAGGKVAADGIIEAIDGKGKIGLITHPDVESGQMRTAGFIDRLKETGKDKDIEIMSQLPALGSRERAYSVCLDMMQAYPDLDAIFCINDPTALGALAALESIGKADRVKLVGFDGQPEAKEAIRDGKIYASSIQFPDRLGVMVVQAFINYMNGEDVPAQELIPTELYRQADGLKDPTLSK